MILLPSQYAATVLFRANAIVFGALVLQQRLLEPSAARAPSADEEEGVELLAGEEKADGGAEPPTAAKAAKAAGGHGHGHGGMAQPLEWTASSLRQLTWRMFQLSLILFYCWWSEASPWHPHEPKITGLDLFWFSMIVFLGAAALTIKKGHGPTSSDLVGRDLTEEWKGWMQYAFIAYHYFHTPEMYNPIRVFVSCYVWMTGFGNFSFFYIKQDFGFVRVVQMLWRLFFLVLCLSFTQSPPPGSDARKPLILYYIIGLHSFYFFVVYVTMRIRSSSNRSFKPIRVKLLALMLLTYVVWDVFGVFDVVWGWLSQEPIHGAVHGTLHEWHFRTYLDHYSAMFGMAFALVFPVSDRWLRVVAQLPPAKAITARATTGGVLALLFGWWYTSIYSLDKFEFNKHNPYLFFIPLLVYIWFRNVTKTVRSYQSRLLVFLGKITLETYLFQHHILMTDDAKSRSVLIADWPMTNMVVVCVIFVFCSHRMYRLTLELRAMFLPNDYRACVRYVAGTAGVVAAFALLGLVLSGMEAGVADVSVAVVVVVGIALVVLKTRALVPPMSAIAFALILELVLAHSVVPLLSVNQPGAGAGAARRLDAASPLQEHDGFVSFLGRAGEPDLGWAAAPALEVEPRLLEDVPGEPKHPTKAFVVSDPALGAFAVAVFAIMIFSSDAYALIGKLGLATAGATLDVDETYAQLHQRLG